MSIVHAGNLVTLFHEEFTDVKQKYGHDCLFFHRVDLHQGLLRLATEKKAAHNGEPATIRLGAEVTNLDPASGIIYLASGEQLRKDLIVIADGARVSSLLTARAVPTFPVTIPPTFYRTA